MAANTMRFLRVPAATVIFGVSYGLQVRKIHTCAGKAQMIKLMAFRNLANKHKVRPAMRTPDLGLALEKLKGAVAIALKRAYP